MIIMHYQGEKSYVDVYTPHLSWFLDEDVIRSPRLPQQRDDPL